MAEDQNERKNTTGTELQVLQNIEKAYFDQNPNARKRNTSKSLDWFRKYVPRTFNKVRTARMFRDRDLWESHIKPGNLYFFEYDAIHKDTLPVWDQYPLIFPWDSWRGKNGKLYFIAINLHYLSPKHRYIAMKALLKLRNEKRYRKSTRLKISWQVLKGLSQSKMFENCVKMYRVDHVKSVFVKVPPSSWELAIFLPTARWHNGGKSVAWSLNK